jgi:hypothetical protein
MRHHKPFITFLGILIFISLISSCKKEKPDPKDPNTEQTDTTGNNATAADSIYMLFTAQVNGVDFEADTNMISYEFDDALQLHVITAADGVGHIVTLMMSSLEPGTYDVDFDNNIVIYQNGLTIYNGGFNPEGQIVITHHEDNTISGTFHASLFNFDTAQDLELTSGHFIHIPAM